MILSRDVANRETCRVRYLLFWIWWHGDRRVKSINYQSWGGSSRWRSIFPLLLIIHLMVEELPHSSGRIHEMRTVLPSRERETLGLRRPWVNSWNFHSSSGVVIFLLMMTLYKSRPTRSFQKRLGILIFLPSILSENEEIIVLSRHKISDGSFRSPDQASISEPLSMIRIGLYLQKLYR